LKKSTDLKIYNNNNNNNNTLLKPNIIVSGWPTPQIARISESRRGKPNTRAHLLKDKFTQQQLLYKIKGTNYKRTDY